LAEGSTHLVPEAEHTSAPPGVINGAALATSSDSAHHAATAQVHRLVLRIQVMPPL
jgi:hypothetical protein